MHFSTLTLPILLASALAFPANITNIDNAGIVARGWCSKAWLGSVDVGDIKSKKPVLELKDTDRPKLDPQYRDSDASKPPLCRKLTREGGRNTKIFWGECDWESKYIHVFYDEHCKEYAQKFEHGSGKGETTWKKCTDGDESCFNTEADKRPWKSVRALKW